MKILHLHLMFKYYDMIDKGDKREEYRSLEWLQRTCGMRKLCKEMKRYCTRYCYLPDEYTHVCFWRGYSKEKMLWEIDRMVIAKGRPEWGASRNDCLIIVFHERVVKDMTK